MKLRTRMMLVIGTVLVIFMVVAFAFIFNAQRNQAQELYRSQASAMADNIFLAAKTISKHGGIYAVEKDGFGVNPYLAKIPGIPAEITATNGKKYAMMNGFAFIMELMKVSKASNMPFDFRVPSDKALNPINNASPAELRYLNQMRSHKLDEYYEKKNTKDGETYFVYSKALKTVEGCVQPCHMNYKMGEINGMINIKLPVTAAEARAQQNMWNLVYIFAAALLLVLCATYLLANHMTKPIKELALAADRISKGETDINLNINRKDEIGELAEAFSRMTASLKILMMSEEETNQDLPKTGTEQ